jgi:hypothetical protein
MIIISQSFEQEIEYLAMVNMGLSLALLSL